MKRLILAGLLALSANALAANTTIDVMFTDADIILPEGGAVPGCIVEVPGSTTVAVAPCSDVAKPVIARLRKALPNVILYITLNGQRLSEA